MPEVVEDTKPCLDVDCSGPAEMEVDGSYRYWECVECGSTFGFEQVVQTHENACGLGIPEDLRRAASESMAAQQGKKLLPLTVTGVSPKP